MVLPLKRIPFSASVTKLGGKKRTENEADRGRGLPRRIAGSRMYPSAKGRVEVNCLNVSHMYQIKDSNYIIKSCGAPLPLLSLSFAKQMTVVTLRWNKGFRIFLSCTWGF